MSLLRVIPLQQANQATDALRSQREEKEAGIRKKWDSLLAESEQEEMLLKRDLKGLQQTKTSEGGCDDVF